MSDGCSSQYVTPSGEPHLLVVGGGSAAFAAALKANELGARVTLVNDGLPTGGTCVNVGCVPSKTLIRAAEAHYRAAHHNFAGIESNSRVTDFKAIISQKRDLVGQLRQQKYIDVVSDLAGIQLLKGRARLTSANSAEVNGQSIPADRILIATGVRPLIPPIPGLEDSGYLTNESAFELEELPESLIVLGGRYIALESAQLFGRLGSRVTILQRSPRILPTETPDVTEALTGYLQDEGIEVVTRVSIESVNRDHNEVVVQAQVGGEPRSVQAAHILVATGRRPNTDQMGLQSLGISVDSRGFLQVDPTLQTNIEGIYGAGDVIGEPMYVYTAAYEGALAAENAITGEAEPRDYSALPWVIFTDPQVAGVGMDEEQATRQGIEVDTAKLPLSQVPRSLAARDSRGFIKLIRDRNSDKLVGARILAPEGSELLMEISLAIKFGITVNQLTSSFHPYLTLCEGVKLAALTFEKDVSKLSCCAV
ncbi:mercury(II) reductase [Acidobacteria bacterium AH-259-O06]|nr:mercury(II) reductase [Acidobacteria bacterium AH-259-O06]